MSAPTRNTVAKTLMLSLQPPAKVFISGSRWEIAANFYVDGMLVDGNDTPWVSLADLLVDPEARTLVGLSFLIDNQAFRYPMREISEWLDRRVTRYNDVSTVALAEVYGESPGGEHRFEITWSRGDRIRVEIAQLCCGQWFWWYAREGDWGICKPIIAFGLTDIDDILNTHALDFAEPLPLPPLPVTFRCSSGQHLV
jgi:hypothetical protein